MPHVAQRTSSLQQPPESSWLDAGKIQWWSVTRLSRTYCVFFLGGLGLLLLLPALDIAMRLVIAARPGFGIHAARPALLDLTSMWGMGADARAPMKRRTNVPLVTWSAEAVERVASAWQELQQPRRCDRVMYMYPYNWGLTSQMRDYSDMVIVAMAFRRTLQYVEDASRIKWCGNDGWLECFFEPLSNDMCRRKQNELKDAPIIRISAWDQNIHGMAFAENKTIAVLASSLPVIHFPSQTRFNYVLDHPSLFPHDLWEGMIKDGLVHARDHFGHPINLIGLKLTHPSLYHTLSLSAFRTMITPIVFRPNQKLEIVAKERLLHLNTRKHHDCLAVHLRWTDKQNDGGVALERLKNDAVGHVVDALDRITKRSGRSYRCILVLSDDDVGAIRELRRLLGDAYDIKQVSQIQFTSHAEYNAYRLQGHEFFTRGNVSVATPDRTYAYIREVLIDVMVVAEAADYLIGVGSSGVSQLVAQYMGAARRADANAFAVWEEDILTL